MSTKVVVYTADSGRYDDVHPALPQERLPADVTVEWGYLGGELDRERRLEASAAGWTPYHFPPGRAVDWPDRLAAKWAKFHPHVLFPDADLTVWVDASLEVTSSRFASDLLAQTPADGFALFPHPDRSDVRQELVAADPLPRCRGNDHAAMVTTLETVQGPASGLWALGVVARRPGPKVSLTDHLTWTTVLSWTRGEAVPSDQLVFPFTSAWTGVAVRAVEAGGDLWENPWFARHPHRGERA